MRARDEQKKLQIINEAIVMIVNDGFDGLSMQKLAKAANVSPATIYIYFNDREDLIQKVAIHAVDQMISSTFTGFDTGMNFAKGLEIQWKNRMRYWLDNPMNARFMEQIRHSRLGVEVFRKVKEEFSAKMKEFLHGAIKRGEVVKLPVEIYWSIAFAPLYQLIKFHTDGKGMQQQPFTLDDKTMKKTLQLVLKALKP